MNPPASAPGPSTAVSEADLSACAMEPIHIPGAVQPHGCLLVVDGAGVVTQASANAQSFLALERPPLGEPAQAVLGAAWEQLDALDPADEGEAIGFETGQAQRRLWLAVHRQGPLRLIEVEDAPVAAEAQQLQLALAAVAAASSQEELLQIAAESVRSLTGFDRVMVYRFDEDDHGAVIAEVRAPEMEPYLGLHYPESDIPRQARALYLRNWIRYIPDAGYRPVPIAPTLRPDTGQPLDMSRVQLRSVSPVHLEYMHNMGVGASLSISLVVQGRLWGLVSCGHRTARHVSHRVRAACESMGRVVSLQLAAFAAMSLERQLAAAAGAMQALRGVLGSVEGDVLLRLLAAPTQLTGLTMATGVAVVQGSKVHSRGLCPDPDQVLRIAARVAEQASDGLFATRQLALLDAGWQALAATASGVLAFTMPGGNGTLLWFRPELVQTVNWGGDPRQPAQVTSDAGGTARLHPRRSFALWQEELRGRSLPWGPAEKHLAAELRRSAVEQDLQRQLQLQKAAVKAREDLVAVVSHDLRTPVSIVVMQATLLQRLASEVGGERSGRLLASVQTIQRSADRMTSLLRDLLDLSKIEAGRFELIPAPHGAAMLVADACELMQHVASLKGVTVIPADAPPTPVFADAERVFQVFANLIGNSVKFTPAGGTVTVGAIELADACEFFVRDTGAGIAADQLNHVFDRYWQGRATEPSPHGAGLGLYICKGIVEAHGGRMRVESTPGAGSTFYFTIPKA